MMNMHRFPTSMAILALLLYAPLATAEARLAGIFGDHMVLQQASAVPIWGTASPGEPVAVAVAGHEAKTIADQAGKWMVNLDALPTSADPVELRVTGANAITLHDVLIGDVWLASGQSNMEFSISKAGNAADVLPHANDPQLRLCVVQRMVSFVTQDDTKAEWLLCTPDNLKKIGFDGGFSAVAYFFGKDIRQDRKVPVGLIQSAWGGTTAQSWTSLQALQANPQLNHWAEAFLQSRQLLEHLKSTNPALPPWEQPHNIWFGRDPWYAPYLDAYNKAVEQGDPLAVEAAAIAVKKQPKRPVFAGFDSTQPTIMFNSLINPIIPIAIKGIIWYQGEGNTESKDSCKEYATLFPAMIQDWRQRWGKTDAAFLQVPFIFVQLPNYDGWDWPLLREAQQQAMTVGQTGMAITIDLGEEKNIHPKDKIDVGHRLALIARHLAYAEDLVYSGPVYQAMQIDGNKIRLKFSSIGGGLTIGVSPATPGAAPSATLDGFEIGPAEYHMTPAQATIDGDTVVVWSDSVPNPKVVHYAWAGYPKPPANLYNKEGLPAAPFKAEAGK